LTGRNITWSNVLPVSRCCTNTCATAGFELPNCCEPSRGTALFSP